MNQFIEALKDALRIARQLKADSTDSPVEQARISIQIWNLEQMIASLEHIKSLRRNRGK